MKQSEILSKYGHENFEWALDKKQFFDKKENGELNDYGPFDSWKRVNGILPQDEIGNFTMAFIPYWDNDNNNSFKDFFTKFYTPTLSNGEKAQYAGYIKNLIYENLLDEDNKKIGEVLIGFDFDEESYNKYIDSFVSLVPDVIENLCKNSDRITKEKNEYGTVPNCIQATCTTLDGEELTVPINFEYDEINQQKLNKAVFQVLNGATSANVFFNDEVLPMELPKEMVLRLYLEMETYLLVNESRNIAYKAMVKSHGKDDKNQAENINSTYSNAEMDLEEEYETLFNNLVENGMKILQELATKWEIN